MFDPVTAAFVRAAPPLPGLDPNTLDEEITSLYVEIASARLSLGQIGAAPSPELERLVERMGRLADTYEAMIALELDQERRQSAAFVAASARQVIATVAGLQQSEPRTSRLDEDAVGAEIAASLLFLIAERSSDAYEAARDIRAAGEPNPIRRMLILALGRFARGQLPDVASTNVDAERLGADESHGLAADLLFRELLRGLILMAEDCLGT